MHSFRLASRARDDIKSIGRYTKRHWGKTQRNIYLRDLESRIDAVYMCISTNSTSDGLLTWHYQQACSSCERLREHTAQFLLVRFSERCLRQ
jgi:hypothetical protein